MLHCPCTFARTIAYSGFVLASALLTSSLTPALAADPTGDWKVADGVANIRVAQCNGSMWGVVAWEKVPGGKDSNNPDPARQRRPTLGMPILIDMKKKPGADAWEGQVYNAKDGQTYSSTIKPVGNDQLEIQGCVLGFLCGGETWTRAGPPIPSSPTNSMAKSTPPKGSSSAGSQAASQAPKTTGSANPGARTAAGQKQAGGASSDVVGDICLIPDIARFAH
jgi:uncharacterized protein (DUF2147 family)